MRPDELVSFERIIYRLERYERSVDRVPILCYRVPDPGRADVASPPTVVCIGSVEPGGSTDLAGGVAESS
ncbi:hypothetical protein BRC77_10925 [Halobacteriales archaeon QH_8_64_26]|nr:MAG: hypothetical protein BRC77_10925 [Halobacteriales archaeon QH_8_64_26]